MVAETTYIGKVYDAKGDLIETIDFGAPNRAKNGPDGALADRDTPALQRSEPHPPTKPSELFFTRTFEFRLRGTDVQQRSIDLPTMLSEYRIVPSTNHVRTFVTRGPESAAASNLIGGVEVSSRGVAGHFQSSIASYAPCRPATSAPTTSSWSGWTLPSFC